MAMYYVFLALDNQEDLTMRACAPATEHPTLALLSAQLSELKRLLLSGSLPSIPSMSQDQLASMNMAHSVEMVATGKSQKTVTSLGDLDPPLPPIQVDSFQLYTIV